MRGRKPAGAVAMEKIRICLPADMVDYLDILGEGNVSAGVRRVVSERMAGVQSTAKPSTSAGGDKPTVRVMRMPVYKEPDEYTPDGSRRNIITMTRLRRDAEEEYQQELKRYNLMNK